MYLRQCLSEGESIDWFRDIPQMIQVFIYEQLPTNYKDLLYFERNRVTLGEKMFDEYWDNKKKRLTDDDWEEEYCSWAYRGSDGPLQPYEEPDFSVVWSDEDDDYYYD